MRRDKAMKKLVWLLTITLCGATGLAQNLAGQTPAADVQIIKSRIDPGIDRATANRKDYDGRLVNQVSPTDDGPVGQYRATVVIRNNGSKKVKAVTWAVVFQDLDTHKELEHRTFSVKKSLDPGAEKTLTHYLLAPQNAGFSLSTVLDRVEYADGSVWQRP